MIADDASMRALMQRAQGGDGPSYAAVLHAAADWLRRYFRRKIAPDRLDDLVQEVLLSLHQKRATYDPARAFFPWLAAIARYRWVDHLRAEYRHAADCLDDGELAEDWADPADGRLSLDAMFAHLPAAQVAAIELVRIQGLSIKEASAQCGQSEALIKVNIHRGLRKLAALVEEVE